MAGEIPVPSAACEATDRQPMTRGRIAKAKGVCKVAGEIVSEAEVMFSVMDK
jgi:3-hydroxymyristoyl/3-hydroxydecanoyl-(acyl carrier protein) dehydratase